MLSRRILRNIRRGPPRPDAVTMEVGRDEAQILVAAHADGRIRVALGSGEEYFGPYDEMPWRVGEAVERILDRARPFVGRLPAAGAGPAEGTVRFTLRAGDGAFRRGCRLVELKRGGSEMAPLWGAFSELMRPALVALFKRVSDERARQGMPGLVRARNLWGSGRSL